jgi:predicted amidohydrolase
MTGITAAAVRLGPRVGDREGNLALALKAIEDAAAGGAHLVVLPELATSGYTFEGPAEAWAAAEPVPGLSTDAWAEAAARLGVVVVGGVCELGADGALRNSAVVLDADGTVCAVYRKIHLWGIERGIFVEGSDPAPVVETAVGRVGVAVCFDLWFPEHTRSLALRGTQILACPSNFTRTEPQPGLTHPYLSVAIATAQLNHVHVVLADRCLAERGSEWLGLTVVVDADGVVLAGPPSGDGPGTAIATFDPEAADDKRWGPANDLISDRRPATYELG